MKAHLGRMLQSMSWADGQVLDALRGQPSALQESLRLLGHLLAAEHIWLSRLRGEPPAHPVWPQLSLDECAALAASNAEGYTAFLQTLADSELDRAVVYRTTSGQEFTTSVVDILTHVVLHGAYHRGQIATACGRAGVPAASTDFIMFVRSLDSPGG